MNFTLIVNGRYGKVIAEFDLKDFKCNARTIADRQISDTLNAAGIYNDDEGDELESEETE